MPWGKTNKTAFIECYRSEVIFVSQMKFMLHFQVEIKLIFHFYYRNWIQIAITKMHLDQGVKYKKRVRVKENSVKIMWQRYEEMRNPFEIYRILSRKIEAQTRRIVWDCERKENATTIKNGQYSHMKYEFKSNGQWQMKVHKWIIWRKCAP